VANSIGALEHARRVVPLEFLGGTHYVAVEDAVRFRDALGITLPAGLPEALLIPVREPLLELVARYARTHGPFTLEQLGRRFGLDRAVADAALTALAAKGWLVEGAFRPGGTQREWCDAAVLATLRQRSLAKLRRAVEPVEPSVLGRLLTTWQGVVRPRAGLDAILDAVERLQGCPLPASVLETDVLSARVAH
jgi:ATP-dependent Lhr-like helicase